MPRRYFHRKDGNQDAIVKVLRQMGVSVHIWGEQADLILQYGWITVLAEVRPEGHPRQARKGRQSEFQSVFRVIWLQTVDDAQNAVKWLRTANHAISPPEV